MEISTEQRSRFLDELAMHVNGQEVSDQVFAAVLNRVEQGTGGAQSSALLEPTPLKITILVLLRLSNKVDVFATNTIKELNKL